MSEKKTQVTIRLEKSLADNLEAAASREGLSRSAFAAKLVRDAVGEPAPSPAGTSPELAESMTRIEDLLRQMTACEPARPDRDAELARVVREAATEAVRELTENLPRIYHEVAENQRLNEQQLEKLQTDLSKVAAVILVNGGKADPAGARAWVTKHLLQEKDSPSPAATLG
jgi:hypothetical protein